MKFSSFFDKLLTEICLHFLFLNVHSVACLHKLCDIYASLAGWKTLYTGAAE